MPTLNEQVRQLLSLSPEQRTAVLDGLKQKNPEGYEKFDRFLKANLGIIDEAQGYEHWLRKFGPHTFTGSFAWFHHSFWQWYWEIALQVQDGIQPDLNDLVCLIPWSRDTGKSSHSEWSAIAEGALIRKGYVLWVSAKQEQAQEHVTSIRNRIEDEKIGKIYPWLGKPKVGAHGNRFGWGKEFLMTAGGWAVRPAGLDAYLRGGKVLDMRPTLIVISDVDEIGDSPSVVQNKEQMLTRSVLPMGGANTRIIFDQNPIHANSVMNRILTRTSSALATRRVIGINDGPVPAFENIQIEFQQTDRGPKHVIVGGTPTWPDMDINKCQVFLDRSGYEAFMAEYQHDLEIAQEEKVLPEYDDRKLLLHVISWDMFEKLYGWRRIPPDWPCDLGVDLGYSATHLSSWTFMAKVPEGYPLSGSVFRYRGRNFQRVSIDDQSISVRRDMWPDEVIQRQWMSHEGLGERLLLVQKHGWAFRNCDSGKESGWQAWRHYLRADRSQPHPFHTDNKEDVTGLWKLGRPAFFDIVVHGQLRSPVDDHGLKTHRESSYNHRRRPVKLTDSGYTVEQPVKAGDDPNDSSRMIFASSSFGPSAKAMSQGQKVAAVIPQGYHVHELVKRTDLHPNEAFLAAQMAEFLAKKQLGLHKPKLVDPWGQPLG